MIQTDKLRSVISILFLGLLLLSCEENLPPNVSVYFVNRTGATITVQDNSGAGMFEEVTVKPHSTKNVTYVCPDGGSCTINFVHSYIGAHEVCVCFDGYQYNERYTFGYRPSNEEVSGDEKCTSCRD